MMNETLQSQVLNLIWKIVTNSGSHHKKLDCEQNVNYKQKQPSREVLRKKCSENLPGSTHAGARFQ